MMELLDEEVVGVANLRKVAADLYGDVESLPETLGPHIVGEKIIHEVHRGMYRDLDDENETIYLHLPGIKRDELSLRSNEGILYVGLNGREREIPTEVPTKASKVEAKLEEDVLSLIIPLNQ